MQTGFDTTKSYGFTGTTRRGKQKTIRCRAASAEGAEAEARAAMAKRKIVYAGRSSTDLYVGTI